MKKAAFVSLFLVQLLAPLPSSSSTEITAHIVTFGTYGNGNVYVTLDRPLDESGCATPYIELAAGNPSIKAVLTVAAISATTGAAVQVKTDGCFSFASSTMTARGYFGLVGS